MSNIKTNTKGSINVKSKGSSNANDQDEFSSAKAEVIRDESRWDAFQLIGDSNTEEQDYLSVPPTNEAETSQSIRKRAAFINKRLRALGGKVTAVYGFAVRS